MKKKRDNYANKINRNKKINKFIIVGVVVAIALIVGVAVATIRMLICKRYRTYRWHTMR